MATRYRYATTLAFTDETDNPAEIDVEVSFTVAWGSPETGRGYMADPYLYDPGSPDEVEDLRLELIDGKPAPWVDFGTWADDQTVEAAILQQIAQNHTDNMLQEAADREAAWAEQ